MTALLMAREMAGDACRLLTFVFLSWLGLKGCYAMICEAQEARKRDRTPAINIEAVRPAYSRSMPPRKSCLTIYAESDHAAIECLIGRNQGAS